MDFRTDKWYGRQCQYRCERRAERLLAAQATPNNYRIDRISDAPIRNKKQTVIILILLDKFRAEKGR
jgi:hypothetical protein